MVQSVDRVLFETGDWVWLKGLSQAGRVIEASRLWGSISYRVWLVRGDTVINVDADQVSTYTAANAVTSESIAYLAAAARVAASQQTWGNTSSAGL